jgi:hypothetical protein
MLGEDLICIGGPGSGSKYSELRNPVSLATFFDDIQFLQSGSEIFEPLSLTSMQKSPSTEPIISQSLRESYASSSITRPVHQAERGHLNVSLQSGSDIFKPLLPAWYIGRAKLDDVENSLRDRGITNEMGLVNGEFCIGQRISDKNSYDLVYVNELNDMTRSVITKEIDDSGNASFMFILPSGAKLYAENLWDLVKQLRFLKKVENYMIYDFKKITFGELYRPVTPDHMPY